ncbi:hypothetical protein HK102_004336 [Quaeritorhiza haematococci]|nr:hypothetical protein HK102_004336 [Quaeritorhiza haematococci]
MMKLSSISFFVAAILGSVLISAASTVAAPTTPDLEARQFGRFLSAGELCSEQITFGAAKCGPGLKCTDGTFGICVPDF